MATALCYFFQVRLFAVVGGMLCKSDKPSIIIIIIFYWWHFFNYIFFPAGGPPSLPLPDSPTCRSTWPPLPACLPPCLPPHTSLPLPARLPPSPAAPAYLPAPLITGCPCPPAPLTWRSMEHVAPAMTCSISSWYRSFCSPARSCSRLDTWWRL